MRFSQDFIERVLEASNIVDIISQYTELRPSGGGLMGRCPFPDHNEKTPSFSVSETKQVYHCFGCHKSGNIFRFLNDYQSMNFPEAVEYLAKRYSIPIPVDVGRENPLAAQEKEKKQKILEANVIAFEFFKNQFATAHADSPVKKYVQQRGLSKEIVDTFGIGFAPAEWNALSDVLQNKNINMSLAEDAKLIRKKQSGSGYFDLFRDRLMFTILSLSGEPIAFGGRYLEKKETEPKYLNSPETPVFIKGKILYGLYQTAKYIRSEDLCVVVEGYMDLVSMYQVDIRNVVAAMGTAFTPDQAKLIARVTKNAVALFDGDAAGIEASERNLPIMLGAGLHPRGLILPDGMDPDDYIKKYGAEALKIEIGRAKDLFSLTLDRWMSGYRGEASQKINLADTLKPVIASIPDPRLKELYVSEAAQRMNVPIPWLKTALMTQTSGVGGFVSRPMSRGPVHATTSASEAPLSDSSNENLENAASSEGNLAKIELKNAPPAEILLMSVALKSRANFDDLLKNNYVEFFTHLGVKTVLTKAADAYRQDPNKFDRLVSLLVSYVDQPELLFQAEKAITEKDGFDAETEARLMKDCVRKVQDHHLREKYRLLAEDVKRNPSPEKLEQLMNIQRDRQSLNKS